jgi:alpha-L-fucosidase
VKRQCKVWCFVIFLVTFFVASRTPAAGQQADSAVQKYDASWESLKRYRVPEWFKDAKFGIFLHWGVYAVPAAGNEWYPRNMYLKDNPMYKHHRETWGDQSKFGYKDFIPLFKAEKWDPQRWVKLFKQAGAKFVVPVAEHHDGFAMYASSHTRWNSVEMGPRRDVVGELAKAVRAQGLKFGASSHYAHNWNYYPHSPEFDTSDPRFFGLYGKPHAPGAPASEEFLENWYARVKEIIDKYQPDVLWFDFGFNQPEFEPYRRKIGAYYYNKGLEWKKGVVLQYKRDAFPYGTAVLDIERGKLDRIGPMVWQTDTSVSWESWGYIENDHFKTADSLVDDLVDIVSKNGVLLLNVGPRADGTIPDQAANILREIGKWLEVNGEAIYGTRPWHTYGEGPTNIHADSFGERKSQPFTAKDIRFTTKGNILYAICLDWPGEEVNIESLSKRTFLGSDEITSISLLGSRDKLAWSRDENGLKIKLPAQKPGDYAYVFKITLGNEVLGTVK